MENVVINGVEYQPVSKGEDVRIVILQRGWVMIGKFSRVGNDCTLHDASVIRKWGTQKGLGELIEGKLPNTVLDKSGEVCFDYLTVVATIKVRSEKWLNTL